jgi:hypothetical protein
MKLSSHQLERLADRVFRVLKLSGYLELDPSVDERVEERALDCILGVLEDDARTEDRLSREAERLVEQQKQIVSQSERPREELIQEVKARLARSKRVLLDDGPDRADAIAEKVLRALWRVDGVDFFAEDVKVRNCIGKAIYRFRLEDDRIVDAVERLVSRKTQDEAYSPKWCQVFDRYIGEARDRILAQRGVPETGVPEVGVEA